MKLMRNQRNGGTGYALLQLYYHVILTLTTLPRDKRYTKGTTKSECLCFILSYNSIFTVNASHKGTRLIISYQRIALSPFESILTI